MITTYTFGKKNNNNTFSFFGSKPKYTKTLDDIIADSIISKNSYLFKSADEIALKNIADDIINATSNNKLAKATKFLANYKNYSNTYKLPFIYGEMYTLSDGTPIVFYDDEIQIGFDVYKYDKFNDMLFLNSLTPKKAKTIIDIYISGTANININL